MSCKKTEAFEDKEGGLHKTIGSCCDANITIDLNKLLPEIDYHYMVNYVEYRQFFNSLCRDYKFREKVIEVLRNGECDA